MARKLIIFGNGLGMALDPDYFRLQHALKHVWDDGFTLDDDAKAMILHCTGGSAVPEGEHELDRLHLAIFACENLANIGGNNQKWLTPEGISFPQVTSQYICRVAKLFHQGEYTLPDSFFDPLEKFLKDTKSHVATLNYDDLMYSSLRDRGVLLPFYQDTYLADGMIDSGFSYDTLKRKRNSDYGFYMHLHGSPLFYSEKGVPHKRRRSELSWRDYDSAEHIVLSHITKMCKSLCL